MKHDESMIVPKNGNGLWQKFGIGLIALLFLKESYGLVDKFSDRTVDIPALFKQQEIILGQLAQAIRDQNALNKDMESVLRQISGSMIIMQEKQVQHFKESSDYFSRQTKYTGP